MMPVDPHRHLDDEVLSAVLDGEADEEERAQASGCPDCSARLERFRTVARALAAPVPPSAAARRRAAIVAALAEAEAGGLDGGVGGTDGGAGGTDGGAGGTGGTGGTDGGAGGLDGGAGGTGGTDVRAPTPLASRRRWRMSPSWAAAAAVVVAAALAVPLVADLGGSDQGEDLATTAGQAEDSSSAGGSVRDQDGAGEAALAPAAPAPARQLGEIELSALDDLAASVEAELRREGHVSAPPAPAEDARPLESQDGGADQAPASRGQPCEEPARGRAPELGRLAYVADASVEGRPALVLVFEAPPPEVGPDVRLLVLAADTCAELGAASA